jgi:hypothetical protein
MQLKDFRRWAVTSLGGHIVVLGGSFALIEFLICWMISNSAGRATIATALKILLIVAPLGIVAALSFWFTVTKPLIRRRESGRRS